MEQPFTAFVRSPECLELVKRIYGPRGIPPDMAAVLEGRATEDCFLGEFIEKIRNQVSVSRGIGPDAYNAALQIVYRSQF